MGAKLMQIIAMIDHGQSEVQTRLVDRLNCVLQCKL